MQTRGADDEDERDYDIDHNDVMIYTSKDNTPSTVDPFSEDATAIKSLDGIRPGKKRSITHMQKRYEGQGGAKSKKIEDHIITGYNAFNVVAPPYNLDNLAKLYEKSTPHKAAVDAKTANIVGLGYDFIPSDETKEKLENLTGEKSSKFQKKLMRAKRELIQELNKLNKEDTFKETLQKVWKDYETTGNGYLEIGRKAGGGIGYIGHVPSTTVRIRRDRDGFVQIIANKAVFFRNFGETDENPFGTDPNPNEIIHFKRYAPSSTFYGVPDIVSASTAVAGNDFAAKFNLDYFENKAVPRHVIILQGATINPKLAKNILEFFETGLKGVNHRSLFVPLPAGSSDKKVELKIEPVEAGIQDASFNNYKKANLSEILMAHRVPINKVGTPEGVNIAVARDADKTFKEQVCRPEQENAEDKVQPVFTAIQGVRVFDFKLNELSLTDEDTQSKIDERRVKTGQRTPNELRVRDGFPEHKDGNELMDLNQKAKQVANEARASGNRERDSQRSAGRTDSAGEGRNAKGDGRTDGTG